MSLLEQLTADMKVAMKARDKVKLGTVRMLIADLKKFALDQAADLEAKDEIAVLSRAAKQRREAIEAFAAGGRDEMADTERAELKVIEGYLPEQLTTDEVRAMTEEIIAEVGATAKKDMGKVMGQLMPKIKGRFPGKDVRPIVDSLLT